MMTTTTITTTMIVMMRALVEGPSREQLLVAVDREPKNDRCKHEMKRALGRDMSQDILTQVWMEGGDAYW